MLCKMLDYQKNIHAEIVLRELGAVEPTFLAIFGLEELLDVEASYTPILNIFKAYIDRRIVEVNAELTTSLLIKNTVKR
jgi:hypothetical protein